MDAVLFLLGIAVVIALGSLVVLLRHRQPQGDHHGIRQCQREMQALSREASHGDTAQPGGVRIVGRVPKAEE